MCIFDHKGVFNDDICLEVSYDDIISFFETSRNRFCKSAVIIV